MSNNLFMGDTHFGHGGISEKFRLDFDSDLDHDDTIFTNILDASNKRNNLFLMGDIIFKQSEFWRLIDISKNYQSVHYFLGNHDHKMITFYAREYNLDNVYFHGIIKRYGWWLSHAPVHPLELRGGLNVHGHVHRATVPDPRYLNVSCENIGFKPISLHEIREIFHERQQRGKIEAFVERLKGNP